MVVDSVFFMLGKVICVVGFVGGLSRLKEFVEKVF